MKMIIDIPEGTYKAVEVGTINQVLEYKVWNAIKNGTPLEDVKAEMEKHQHSREYCCNHNIDTAIDMSMVRIILDNIGKAESEDKE